MIPVTHIITDLQVGGAERMLARLVTASDRQRFRHTVITLTGGGLFQDQIQAAGIPVHDLGMRRGRPSPLSLWRAVRQLRRDRPQVVQTWLYHADLLGLIAARLAGCPTVSWNLRCSDMDLSRYGRMTGWVVRALAALSPLPHTVLSNSQAGIRAHQDLGYHPKRWQVIPNGLETDLFCPDPLARAARRADLALGDDVVAFVMVARQDAMKDHQGFLTAARQVAAQHPNTAFVAVGRGVDTDTELRALAAQVAAPVYLLGQSDSIPALLAAMDVGVLASHSEGFPNVVVEAMSCGLPNIVTDVGDCRLVVGDAGIVVPVKQPRAMAQAMGRLVADAALRRRMGAMARQRVEQDFGLPAIVARYEQFWTDLANDQIQSVRGD